VKRRPDGSASKIHAIGAVKFGQEVRRRRKAKGLTIEQLAGASGLTPNYIGTIEKNQRDPSLSTVQALAKGFGVSAAELLGGIQGLSPAALEVARLFDGVPPDVQSAVASLLRAVAKKRR
jgi:transcriptional regulator with XRE-family HTH domain